MKTPFAGVLGDGAQSVIMGDLAVGRIQQRISCWETVCLKSTTGARGLDTDDRFNGASVH